MTLEKLQREALITHLVDKFRERGSWTGETRLQKATYFLQQLLDVPVGFRYTFYKYGPFSFDLRDELGSMRADGLLELEPRPDPYGPTFSATERSKSFVENFAKTIRRYSRHIDFVTDQLGDRSASELELLSTALYVIQELGDAGRDRMPLRIRELKPHVSVDDAQDALSTIQTMIQRSRSIT
jgi:uncharacterized protein YwgA